MELSQDRSQKKTLLYSFLMPSKVINAIAKVGFGFLRRNEEGSAIMFSEHIILIYPDLTVDIFYDRSLT